MCGRYYVDDETAAEIEKLLRQMDERKRKEGKAYGVVLNAVKFKLVGRMFAVVKRGTPFVELMTYKK